MPYLHDIPGSITSDLITKKKRGKRKEKRKDYTNKKSQKYEIKDAKLFYKWDCQ